MENKEETQFTDSDIEDINDEFVEEVIEEMVEKGPDIDWMKVTIISDIDTQELTMKSNDPETEENLRHAYESVMADKGSSHDMP